ncbi:hypothetical protein E2C01_073087 [Portunus trituberculatus]|uniref:Uncharacterized protein n=1 Tax=Portunus trituberculatus TaxID=210409 RepID=A0A5B7I9M0_PORTR|nr:hypothetical protein [Portunus trituberculatus]
MLGLFCSAKHGVLGRVTARVCRGGFGTYRNDASRGKNSTCHHSSVPRLRMRVHAREQLDEVIFGKVCSCSKEEIPHELQSLQLSCLIKIPAAVALIAIRQVLREH